jgi:hypothetical protein
MADESDERRKMERVNEDLFSSPTLVGWRSLMRLLRRLLRAR